MVTCTCDRGVDSERSRVRVIEVSIVNGHVYV